MRSHAACEHGVAVVEQVMRREGGGDAVRGTQHKIHGVSCGDMFKHDLESREAFHQRREHRIDEDFFAIENIHCAVRDFTMHQQGRPCSCMASSAA